MMFTDSQEHLVLWIPVLTTLSDVFSSHDLHTVRLWYLNIKIIFKFHSFLLLIMHIVHWTHGESVGFVWLYVHI